MDLFLNRLTQHAINYAIRSGITITAGYALKQTGQLLKKVEAPEDREELQDLQGRLQSKIRCISPAIDMIELISARGNTTLGSAVELTGNLRRDFQAIAERLEKAAAEPALAQRRCGKQANIDLQLDVKSIIRALKRLLTQIDDAVPFLSLAITASGAKISSSMPATISPSRLLQASTFITTADSHYALSPGAVQVGPTFTLSLYMLFAGHVRPQVEDDVRSSTWKEVAHKLRLKLLRVPLGILGDVKDDSLNPDAAGAAIASNRVDEYAYQLVLIEDLDDDRVHTFDEGDPTPGPFQDVKQAGIREVVPIHELSKIFYADTGKILNIGSEDDGHRPILLLKRDVNAEPHRRMAQDLPTPSRRTPEQPKLVQDPIQSALDAQLLGQPSDKALHDPEDATNSTQPYCGIPLDLDSEWLAFEVYSEEPDTDEDEVEDSTRSDTVQGGKRAHTPRGSADSLLASRMSAVQLNSPGSRSQSQSNARFNQKPNRSPFPQIRTSLSLLEVLLRLAFLQQFQQLSHLSIEDEFLNFFLNESSSTGAATGDDHERKRLREDAKKRVGFDPYNESPIKRRGEDYQYRGGTSQAGWATRPQTPGLELPDTDDLPMLQSIEESDSPYPQMPTGVITPNYGLSSSDLPPFGVRSSPSARLTPELSTSPAFNRQRSSLLPDLSRGGLSKPAGLSKRTSSHASPKLDREDNIDAV